MSVGTTNKTRQALAGLTVFVVALASRVLVIPDTPTEWDSVQFVFGMWNFDLHENSPHPPGYWLYVEAGRFVRWLTPLNETHSLSAVSSLFSALSAVLAWHIGMQLRGRLLAVTFTALIVAMPFSWFYGAIPGVYTFDLFAGLVFMAIALREEIRNRDLLIAVFALGLLTGTRQSAFTVFGPIVVYIAWRARPSLRVVATAVCVGAAAMLIWVLPASLEQPGGLSTLLDRSKSMWENAADQTSILSGAPSEGVHFNIGRATAAPVVSLLFAMPVFVLLAVSACAHGLRQTASVSTRRVALVVVLTALPGFLVTVLGYYGKPGYVLAYIAAALLIGCLPLLVVRKSVYTAGCGALLVISGVWGHQFLEQDGILPRSLQNDDTWWFTQDKYGAPYRDNVNKGMDLVDADAAQYKPLRELTNANDTFVYEGQEGVWRFRQQNHLFPDRLQVLTADSICIVAFQRHIADCPPNVILVQPGGRAVFVANAPADVVKEIGTPVALPTGPTAFAVTANRTLGKLSVVESDGVTQGVLGRNAVVTP